MREKEKIKEKAFNNFRTNGLHLNFANGNHLSTIWGGGSYSENHDNLRDVIGPTAIQSNDVEIMFDCGEKLKKRIIKKYNEGYDQPIGYLTISQWVEIVNLLNKESKKDS